MPFTKDDPNINRAGRPKDSFSLITLLKNELQACPEGQDKKTYADLIIKRMLKESIEKGDQQQIKLIWNYIEGQPKQSLDIKGEISISKVLDNLEDGQEISEQTVEDKPFIQDKK